MNETFPIEFDAASVKNGTLSALTGSFREGLALAHDKKARSARALAAILSRKAYDSEETLQIHAFGKSNKWHKQRAKGQRERFARLGGCGAKKGLSKCDGCGTEKTFLVGCGINRLCERCGTTSAIKRRARFSMARAARVLQVQGAGLFTRRRPLRKTPRHLASQVFGIGKFTEKMLTLTIPHFGDDVQCVQERIAKIFEAWREFSLVMQRQLRARQKWDPQATIVVNGRRRSAIAFHRAFEWTQGGDALGHPHFHVWVLSPFVNYEAVRSLWTESLRKVGIEFDGDAIVNLKGFETLSPVVAREVIKAGKKKAIQYSGRVQDESAAFSYADGWSLHDVGEVEDDVKAGVYVGLESKRVSQGAAGFYAAVNTDVPCTCDACGLFARPKVTFSFLDEDKDPEEGRRWGPPKSVLLMAAGS